jgi:DNA-binding transcriptional LysR family regulator
VNLHRLDLFSLSLFSLVARSGSISKGAELALLAVGAASKRITDLEAAVGTALLERHSRGVTLTVAGEALQDIAAFVAANPGIRIELEEENSGHVVAAVLDGRADFGIFADRTPAFGLQVMNYREDLLVLVVPRGHALARRRAVRFEEAIDYDFVSLPKGTSLAKRLQAEAQLLGRTLKMRIQVRSFDAMCQMVAAGMGVGVLPGEAIRPHVRSMKLRQIALDDAWARRRLLIGLRDANAVPRHVRTLIDHLCKTPSH